MSSSWVLYVDVSLWGMPVSLPIEASCFRGCNVPVTGVKVLNEESLCEETWVCWKPSHPSAARGRGVASLVESECR